MTFPIFTSFATILIAWTLYNAFCLFKNYTIAVKIGLPVIISPVTPENPLWIALQVSCERIVRHVPFHATSFTRYTRLGWEFTDRYKTALRMGDAWTLVTPSRNWFHIANPPAVTNVLQRGRDFIHPVWMLEPLTVFGPNISVAEGQDWQRQRKLTVTPFNESKNPLVWEEAIRQTKQMMEHWRSIASTGSNSTADDARTVALNVLAFTAFQKSYPFKNAMDHQSKSTSRGSMTYRDSIATILNNVHIVLVIPRPIFSLPFLPQSWQTVGEAISFFRQYMLDEIREEKDLIAAGRSGTGSLVSNLVRAGQNDPTQSDHPATATGGLVKPLTEAEILGNIFVFNFAGHDTTAISLSYALLLLVAHPDVQDWIHEEIEYYTEIEHGNIATLDYNVLFPKLKRCLAVLLETLRLYNPLPGVPKYTGDRAATIPINGKTYTIPANTLVIPHLATAHTHPRHWGNDSLVWRPQRWIEDASGDAMQKSDKSLDQSNSAERMRIKFEHENLLTPEKGVYFAWSEGLRNCPGKKFAQVEFVAIIATLFRSMVGEPVLLPGENMEKACQRILGVVNDSTVQLLLQMNNPGAATVRWKQRD